MFFVAFSWNESDDLQVLRSRPIHGKPQLTPSVTTLMDELDLRAILHDPELYPDPFEFKPERFLDECHEHITFAQQPDPTIAGTFGFGRR